MVFLEVSKDESGVPIYYIKDTPNAAGFVCAKVSGLEDKHLLYYCRARPLVIRDARDGKYDNFEIGVYQKVIAAALEQGLGKVRFKIFNLSLDFDYYSPISVVTKARVNDEKYMLRLGDLPHTDPKDAKPKSLLKTKERLEIQARNKARAKGAKHNEDLRFREKKLYQFPLSNDPRNDGGFEE